VTKPDQLVGQLAALNVDLTSDEVAYLDEPYLPGPAVGFE
jgi:aryl-alcohol dehydrogenase-like predicted oxidoreductase